MLAQLNLQSVLRGEFNEHWKQKKLQDLRDNLRVNRDGIDALVNVDKAFDDPLPFIGGNGLRERRSVCLKVSEKLF